MPRSLLFSLLVWLFELMFVIALVSADWMQSVQRTEVAMTRTFLGVAEDRALEWQARRAFEHLFVRTGIQSTVWHYFIPSEAERRQSIGFEEVGRDQLFPFIGERLAVFWQTVYQMLRRLFAMIAWWPYALTTLFPCLIDGLVGRTIKQSNFAYSSPLAHRYSLFVVLGVGYALLVGLTLPLPIPPVVMPCACIIVALACRTYLAHTQKRI